MSAGGDGQVPMPRDPTPLPGGAVATLERSPNLPGPAILAAMPDGCLLTSGGEILEANEAVCRLTGFSRAQLVGLSNPFPFWPRAEDATSYDLTTRVLTQTSGEVDVVLSRADGSRFTASVSARRVTDDLLITIIRDVSLARAQQAELVAGRALLAQAQAQALLGSWSYDVVTGATTWSAQMFALAGLREGEIEPSGEDFLTRVHPDDQAAYVEAYLAGLRSGDAHTVDYRLVRADGEVRHVHGTAIVERDPVTGRAVQLRGSAQDVTDRVLREHALVASEEQFRITMQHSPIGLAIVGLDGRWLQVNDALARMFGARADDLLNSTFQADTHPEDRGSASLMVRELIDGVSDSFQQDRRMVTPDNRTVWVSVHVALVRSPAGEPEHFVVQVVDITARRMRAETLERQAGTDPLTGLANRRTWEPVLLGHLDGVGAGDSTLVVCILDLDRFKTFNDTFGHPVGDRLLVETAAAWTDYVSERRPGALLARLGGEEFGLAMPNTSIESAVEVIAELRRLVPRGQTASAGITPAHANDDPASVMTRADAALYAAKNQGRNRSEVLLAY